MKSRIWISKKDGSVRALHNPTLESVLKIPVDKAVRVSHINFNPLTKQWEVTLTGDSNLLFSHPFRQACVEWEQDNLTKGILGKVFDK